MSDQTPLTHSDPDKPADNSATGEKFQTASNAVVDKEISEYQQRIRQLEAAVLHGLKRAEHWQSKVRVLEQSTSFRLGRVLVEATRHPRSIAKLPAGLLRLWRGRHDSLKVENIPLDYIETFVKRGEAEMLREIDESTIDLADREKSQVNLHIAKLMNEAGFSRAENHLIKRAFDFEESKQAARALYFSSKRVNDIELSCEMVDRYCSLVGSDGTPQEIKRMQQMMSDPVYQLSVRTLVPQPQPPEFEPVRNRVCYVLHNSLPHASGGYATRAQGLAKALSIEGFEVIGLTRPGFPVDLDDSDEADFDSEDIVDDVQYVRSFAPRRRTMPFRTYIPKAAAVLKEKFELLRPQVVIAASNYISALPALIAANSLGIPFIYEVRGFWEVTRASREPSYTATPSYRVQQLMEAFVADQAVHTVTLTGAMARELSARGVDSEKISILPNACNPEIFVPRAIDAGSVKSDLGIPVDACVIGYVGTFVDYEGLPDLVEACSILRKRGQEFRLLLVGSDNTSDNKPGPVATQIQMTAEKYDVSDWLVTPGRVPHDKVQQYYATIDIAAFPRKPWPVCEMVSPMKPLEALCLEKAVVVSSVEALSEMIQDNVTGLVYEKGNVEALADSLSRLIDDAQLRSELGQRGRAWVEQERTWQIVAKRLSPILSQMENRS